MTTAAAAIQPAPMRRARTLATIDTTAARNSQPSQLAAVPTIRPHL